MHLVNGGAPVPRPFIVKGGILCDGRRKSTPPGRFMPTSFLRLRHVVPPATYGIEATLSDGAIADRANRLEGAYDARMAAVGI
jgi:hypothetical protein